MDEEKPQHKISTVSFGLMLGFAALCDLVSFGLQFIPPVGQILNPVLGFIFNMILWFWTSQKGLGSKGAKAAAISWIVEWIPFIGALPTFSAAVTALFVYSRALEKIPLPAVQQLAKKI
ncbi:MAG: hypothetical protein AAB642_01870 [Patescibacteria group bacterium]